MTQAPFGSRDDIRDHEIAQDRVKRDARAAQSMDQKRREESQAKQLATDDGSPPTVLGRVVMRQHDATTIVELVDRLPGGVPLRLLLAHDRPVEPVNLVGVLKALAHTTLEGGGYSQPSARLWQHKAPLDLFGGASGPLPKSLPAVGEPLYASPLHVDVALEPSDDERAAAHELAVETVDALGPTKARARDLADALRAALASGPHAIEALAAALEEHGRPMTGAATTTNDEPPPRAA